MNERNQVLKQRSITGLVFGAIVITAVSINMWTLAALFTAILVIGSSEYVTMVWPGDRNIRITAIVLSVITALSMVYFAVPGSDFYKACIITNCLLLISGIINMKLTFINHKLWWPLVTIVYLGMSLGLLASYSYYTKPYPLQLILGLIFCIWMSDSLAYIVGSRLGKNKLWPSISPKKTWEGFIGGGLFTIILAGVLSSFLTQYSTLFWILLAIIVWIVGTLGDLVESSIKRTFNVKDSGSFLPGHGGMLDRFDSFLYIVPFVLLLLLIIK